MSKHKTKYRGSGKNYKRIIYRKLNEFIVDNVDDLIIRMVTLPYSWAQEKDLIELCDVAGENPPKIWGWENNPKNLKTVRRFIPSLPPHLAPWMTLMEGDLLKYFEYREHPKLGMPPVNVVNLDLCSTLNDEVLSALEMLHWHVDSLCVKIPFTITFCLRYLKPIRSRKIMMGEGIPELHADRGSKPKYAGNVRNQMGLVRDRLNKNHGWSYRHIGQETYARPAPGMGVMWGLLERTDS